MAVKKSSEAPVEAVTETPPELETVAVAEPAETPGTWVYIGPSIHRTRLIQGNAFKGTRTSVEKFLKRELTFYRKAALLLVPVSKLAEARVLITSTGNILGKTYAEMAGK